MTTLLMVDNIHTYYGGSHILEGVSLTVNEGEVVALLGRNGVGKTTALRSILQLTPPARGRIRYQGEDLIGMDTHEVANRGIGWIPEERRMFSQLTVKENIRTAVPEENDVKTAIDRTFETFPVLAERKQAKASVLSGGQQQMLAIARGLVGRNDLLLIDEPSEGLAPQIVSDVIEALEEAATDKTILLVEQNLQIAMDLSDRFYVLDNGQIVTEGGTDEADIDNEELRRHISA